MTKTPSDLPATYIVKLTGIPVRLLTTELSQSKSASLIHLEEHVSILKKIGILKTLIIQFQIKLMLDNSPIRAIL